MSGLERAVKMTGERSNDEIKKPEEEDAQDEKSKKVTLDTNLIRIVETSSVWVQAEYATRSKCVRAKEAAKRWKMNKLPTSNSFRTEQKRKQFKMISSAFDEYAGEPARENTFEPRLFFG
jgi:hypothetical protein